MNGRSQIVAITGEVRSDDENNSDATIVALCSGAAALISLVNAAGDYVERDAWTDVSAVVATVARHPAAAPAALAAKINLWRALAPEDLFDPGQQSLDEQLLVSIIGDAARARALDP